ncbi:hypothetical protein KC960_05515 [Candidatus Saccharibacteria bacterium]|nr:hypothetical protein [Candidatus Saccharibacteria bacterium]
MGSLILPVLVLMGFPIFLLFFFRTNLGVVFLSACGGLVLLNTLDPTVVTTAGAIIPSEGEAYVRLLVVLLSMIFAAMMFRGATKHSHLLLHFMISLLLGVMLLTIIPSSTGISWIMEITKNKIWQNVSDFETLIIAAGMSLSFLAILFGQRKHDVGKHK